MAEERGHGDQGSSSSSGSSSSNGNGNGARPSPAVDFVAGVIAGAAGLVVGQPFDVVKVRYQTPEYNGRYASITQAFSAIVREEKVGGLFKGVLSPMAGIAFINGVVFTSYSFFMRIQLPEEGGNGSVGDDKAPSLGQICLAGAGSGVVSSLITCPIELIKIRQQSAPPHLNPSILSVCRSIIRTDGYRGLYRGFGVTAMRDLAYGPYFCTYEAVCRLFKSMKPKSPSADLAPLSEEAVKKRKHHHESLIDEAEMELASGLTWGELMTAGGVAGVVAWIATFPFDVFKTRMQAQSWQPAVAAGTSTDQSVLRRSNPGLLEVMRTAVRNDGWRVCFAGLGPTLVRAVPVNMIVFVTFEACAAAMSRA